MNYVIALSVLSILAAASWLHSYLLRHKKSPDRMSAYNPWTTGEMTQLRVRASKYPNMRLGSVYSWEKRDPI